VGWLKSISCHRSPLRAALLRAPGLPIILNTTGVFCSHSWEQSAEHDIEEAKQQWNKNKPKQELVNYEPSVGSGLGSFYWELVNHESPHAKESVDANKCE